MDVTGQYLLIKKHTMRKNKRARRRFSDGDPQDMQTMRELAAKYAAAQGEDFLIVHVVEEISKPEEQAPPRRELPGLS
jgi:hypothetical protein